MYWESWGARCLLAPRGGLGGQAGILWRSPDSQCRGCSLTIPPLSASQGGKEYLMRAHFGLPSVEAEDKEGKPPISVKFEIPYFTTSGIQVRARGHRARSRRGNRDQSALRPRGGWGHTSQQLRKGLPPGCHGSASCTGSPAPTERPVCLLGPALCSVQAPGTFGPRTGV